MFNRAAGGAWEALIPHEMPYDRVAFEVACRPGHYLTAEPDGRIVIRQPEWDGEPSDQPGGYESFTTTYDFFPPPPVGDLPFPPTAVAQLQGRVARGGVALQDATGARSYTACHFFEAFSAYTRDPARATAQLVAIAQAYPAIRFLDTVGWYSYWRGREVSPIAFTARDGYAVPATPDYWPQLLAFAQVLQRLGLKAHWTRGDLQLFGGLRGHRAHIRRVCELVRDHGLQDVIEVSEVVNEPPFNGVSLTDARHLAGVMRAELPGTLVSHGAPGGTEEPSELRAWAQGADVGSVHGLRPGHRDRRAAPHLQRAPRRLRGRHVHRPGRTLRPGHRCLRRAQRRRRTAHARLRAVPHHRATVDVHEWLGRALEWAHPHPARLHGSRHDRRLDSRGHLHLAR